MQKFKVTGPLRIQNSLSGNTHILMSTGYYKLLKRVVKGDSIIDKNGKSTKVKDVLHKGRQHVIRVHHEAWHTSTAITKDQEFISVSHDALLLPSNVHYDSALDIASYTYYTGFVTTLLLYSSRVCGENIVLFARKCETVSIKRVNHCLATVFGIHNVDIYDGVHLTKYVIPSVCLPSTLLESIKHRHIAPHLLGQDQRYILGMARGIEIAIKACEVLDSESAKIHLKILCSWINISIPSEHPKHSKYFVEEEEDSQEEDVWELILNDSDTCIANNIICVCKL
jgi:hypothetical protein